MSISLVCAGSAVVSLLFGASSTVPGTVSTDWIGNTFGFGELIRPDGGDQNPSNRKWVQNYVNAMWVSPDGKVFAYSDWDEGGRAGGIYKDGDVVGQLVLGKELFGRNGDIVGDSRYVYVTTRIDWGDWERHGFGIQRFDHDGNVAAWPEGKGYLGGYLVVRDTGSNPPSSKLAIDTAAKELYLWDAIGGGSVLVYDAATMSSTPKAKWPIGTVEAMVSDNDGKLWVLAKGVVRQYSNRGEPTGIAISSVLRPDRIAIDGRKRLLVYDDSTLQVHTFTDIDEEPKLSSLFGRRGGIYSGVKGKVASDKLLPKCAGIGVDQAGNLYMAWGGITPVAGTDIRSYSADGAMRWQVLGHTFVACGGFDPGTDGKDIYFRDYHYTMDYSGEVGKKWSYASFLWDRASEAPEVFGGYTIVRRLQGSIILATSYSDQFAGGYKFYRMNDQVATPAGTLADGSWAWWIERDGDVWNVDGWGRVKRFPFRGLDASGAPVYDKDAPDTFPRPKELGNIQRIHYDPGHDALYVTGYDDSIPAPDEWGRVGTVFARYDGWTDGDARRLSWKVVLPRDNTPEYTLKDMWIEGDYAFFITCSSKPTTIIHVLSLKDGHVVGTIVPGPEIGGDVAIFGEYGNLGWVDMVGGIQAFKRSNGEYRILFEDDLHAKNVMYTWCPEGSCKDRSETTSASSRRSPEKRIGVDLKQGRILVGGGFDMTGRHVPDRRRQ